jgi:hypothetical protein
LTATLASEAANTVLAGPTGAAGAPTFRTLVAADVPRLDLLGAPTAPLSLNNQRITNVAHPQRLPMLLTKSYVDATVQGLDQKPTAQVATTAALPANTYANGTGGIGATLTATANGALTVDGYTPAVGDRILVKNEVAGANNGLYDVTQVGSGATPYILTRNVYMDAPAEFPGALFLSRMLVLPTLIASGSARIQ